MKDLNFRKIFEDSDANSNGMYFRKAYFGYDNGERKELIFVEEVRESYLYVRVYYMNSEGDLSVSSQGRRIFPQDMENMFTVSLGKGIYFENGEGAVVYLHKRADRSSSKGLIWNGIQGRYLLDEVSPTMTQLFLLQVIHGLVKHQRKYISSEGMVFIDGELASTSEELFEDYQETITSTYYTPEV